MANTKAATGEITNTIECDPRHMFGMGQHAFETWLRGMSALAEEMTHFVQARLQEDMSTWAKFTSCRNLNETLDHQREYAAKATSDFLEEANKLSRVAVSLADESLSAFQSGRATTPASEETASTSSKARAA